MGGATPVLDQEAFQGRNDDQAINSATFTYSINADFSQLTDVAFRIRFEFQETAGGSSRNNNFSLQYNKNTGGWNDVNLSSSNVQIENSSQYANGDTTSQVIGDGSFVAGDGVEDPGVQSGNVTLASESTEIEFCLTVVSTDVVDGDTIQLRAQAEGADLDNYSQTPTITVSIPAAASRRIFIVS